MENKLTEKHKTQQQNWKYKDWVSVVSGVFQKIPPSFALKVQNEKLDSNNTTITRSGAGEKEAPNINVVGINGLIRT